MQKTVILAAMVWGLTASISSSPAQTLHHGHGMMSHDGTAAAPRMPGQDLFGAVTEIVGLLNEDPDTDWTMVVIDALRDHLRDMHLVATETNPERQPVPSGMRFILDASGPAGAAAERMLAAHGPVLRAEFGWQAELETADGKMRWTVISPDSPEAAVRIRALGFFGLLAAGAHHQAHHLAIARGVGHPHPVAQ